MHLAHKWFHGYSNSCNLQVQVSQSAGLTMVKAHINDLFSKRRATCFPRMSYPFASKAGKICLNPSWAPSSRQTKTIFCEATASLMQEFSFWHTFPTVTNKDNRERSPKIMHKRMIPHSWDGNIFVCKLSIYLKSLGFNLLLAIGGLDTSWKLAKLHLCVHEWSTVVATTAGALSKPQDPS